MFMLMSLFNGMCSDLSIFELLDIFLPVVQEALHLSVRYIPLRREEWHRKKKGIKQ